jgi:hypothetical protein
MKRLSPLRMELDLKASVITKYYLYITACREICSDICVPAPEILTNAGYQHYNLQE